MGQCGLPIITAAVTQYYSREIFPQQERDLSGHYNPRFGCQCSVPCIIGSQSPAASTHSTRDGNPSGKALPTPTTPIQCSTAPPQRPISAAARSPIPRTKFGSRDDQLMDGWMEFFHHPSHHLHPTKSTTNTKHYHCSAAPSAIEIGPR